MDQQIRKMTISERHQRIGEDLLALLPTIYFEPIRKLSDTERARIQSAILADRERAKPYNIVGTWKPVFTPEQQREHDAYCAEHKTPF